MLFKKNSPTKNFVLDLVGLTERFSGIPIGRIQFYKILASKTGKFDIWAIISIIFDVFELKL